MFPFLLGLDRLEVLVDSKLPSVRFRHCASASALRSVNSGPFMEAHKMSLKAPGLLVRGIAEARAILAGHHSAQRIIVSNDRILLVTGCTIMRS